MGARDLLHSLAGAGLSVSADGDRLVIRPASKLTDTMRTALREAKAELLALLAGGPDDAEAFEERAAIFEFDGGVPRAEAEALALGVTKGAGPAVLVVDIDTRVRCIRCRHYRPGRCSSWRAAGLAAAEVGPDLASLPQRCPSFLLRSMAS
ncbi:MAG: hypothetical protein KGN16_01090 [Burkholderiales bacterium]|nr:hypothetical protein [Burkholderiales bacterium]